MITQERLHELLDYNPDTGIFRWRESGSGRIGKIETGSISANGYLVITVDGKTYKSHRLAILYTDGYLPEHEVDHINRIRTDNRRKNLREASRQCQSRNCGMLKNNTSGVKGVSWDKMKGKWEAYIAVNRKLKRLGCYTDLLEAAYHRYAAEQCLGWADCDINSSAKQFIDSMKEAK